MHRSCTTDPLCVNTSWGPSTYSRGTATVINDDNDDDDDDDRTEDGELHEHAQLLLHADLTLVASAVASSGRTENIFSFSFRYFQENVINFNQVFFLVSVATYRSRVKCCWLNYSCNMIFSVPQEF